MRELLSKKTPLPGIVRIFLLWLGFLAVSSGMGIMLSAGAAGLHPVGVLISLALVVVCVLPISDFYNRRPRAILTGRIAAAAFGVLIMVLSFLFSKISLTGPAPQGFDQKMWESVISQSPTILWHLSMGAALLATLHIAVFFYLRWSSEVRERLGIATANQAGMPLGAGCLALLCLVAVALAWRLLSGLFFQPAPDEADSLIVAAAVTVPHMVAAAALAGSLRKGGCRLRVYHGLALWLGLALVLAAARAWLMGIFSPLLPDYLLWMLPLFLYALPNTLITALPLLWWHTAVTEDGWFSRSEPPLSGFSAMAAELPPPLTMALVFVACQSLLFAFGGVVPSSLGEIAPFSKNLAVLRSFPAGIAMLPFGMYCIYMTLNHPLKGIALCRVFCLAAVALHGVSAAAILVSGVPVVVAGASVLTEIGLLIFLALVCHTAFVVMQKILLLPPPHRASGHNATEAGAADVEAGVSDKIAPAPSHLERVMPDLPPWMQRLMPGKGQPLAAWLFFLFCMSLLAKWSIPSLLEAATLSLSGNQAASLYTAVLLLTALTGFCFPAGMLFIMEKNRDARVFSFLLSLWIAIVILFGIYPAPPGFAFAFLSPETFILVAMAWYAGRSEPFAAWYAMRPKALHP